MVGSVVGLVASLLALVLSLLHWTQSRPLHYPVFFAALDYWPFDRPPRLLAESLWRRGGARACAPARACQAHTRALVGRLTAAASSITPTCPRRLRMIAFFTSRIRGTISKGTIFRARESSSDRSSTSNDNDPEPRQSDFNPAPRRRSRLVPRAILRLWPAVGLTARRLLGARSARYALRAQCFDPRTKRPLLRPVQHAARRIRRAHPVPERARGHLVRGGDCS